MTVAVDRVHDGNVEKLVGCVGSDSYGAVGFAREIATVDDFTCHGSLQSPRWGTR